MRMHAVFRIAWSVVILVAIVGSCSEQPTNALQVGPPAHISLVGQDSIVAEVKSSVPITVLVTDSLSRPVPNQLVNFVPTLGDEARVFAGSAITSAAGQAKEVWILGRIAGPQELEARAVDQVTGAPIVLGSFSGTALPTGPGPLRVWTHYWPGIIAQSPSPAVFSPGTVADSLSVRNPIPFRIPSDDRLTAMDTTLGSVGARTVSFTPAGADGLWHIVILTGKNGQPLAQLDYRITVGPPPYISAVSCGLLVTSCHTAPYNP
jgi:hypothetical protein